MASEIERMLQKCIMCLQAAYSLAWEIKLTTNISFNRLKITKNS